jgi:hypothetical protein
MINVNQITSQLAKMPDQALQKYAMLNKNDPYTVSLALSESNRRKAMREGAAPMPGQMPKVVDQDIAQMAAPAPQPQMPPQAQAPQQQLPENTGIGQLPAQNMQGMADGGIVGYAEGGYVPRYQGNDTDGSVVKSARELLREQLYSLPSGRPGMSYAGNAPTPPSTIRLEEAPPQFLAPGVPNPAYAAYLKREAARDRGVDPQAYDPNLFPVTTSAAPALTKPVTPATSAPVLDPRRTDNPASPNYVGTKPASPLEKLALTKPPTKPATTTAPPADGINALQQENDAIARYKANINKNTETEVNKTDYLRELGAISQPAYDKATAMVEKEKSRLKEGKEQDFYMALIEGGLAAASEKGPNGIQNLAKGFSKGAASYREGLKEFRKASQENAKMELELTRAEAADKKGDIKTYYDRIDKYKDRELTRDNAINQGIAQITNTGYSGQIQEKLTHIKGGYDLQAEKMRNATTLAAASMPGANERLFSTLGKGDVAKGLQRYQEAQTDKTGLGFAKLYVDHVAESNKAGMTPMTEGVFLDTMTRLAAQFNPKTVTDPKKGNLYDRP